MLATGACATDAGPRREEQAERNPAPASETTTASPARTDVSSEPPIATAKALVARDDFRRTGAFPVTTQSAEATVANGCRMRHSVASPTGVEPLATIVLAPGFTRPPSSMEPFARHLASWGFRVVTAPLCSNSPFGVDHAKNGEALAELADSLDLHDVIFSGFSAGGLAAFLAAARSERAAGYVGLDAVDWGDLAVKAASSFTKPAWFIVAEPSSCNADANFGPVLAALAEAPALRVTAASHVDVESGDCDVLGLACTMCGAASPERHALFLLLATAAAMEIAEPTGPAEVWWTPGTPEHDALVATGVIEAAR
jgi:pimeloyl-ACP methyl ester carboxylesterase